MKISIISSIAAAALVILALLSVRGDSGQPTDIPGNNVTVENGRQIIELRAKGGYAPRESIAKAGMPTILRIKTSGTFDCSSAVRIPSMDISRNLPSSGTTDIDIGNIQSGTLQGSCGMGMYPFEVVFEK